MKVWPAIVAVPPLPSPAFAAALSVTVPLPLPEAPPAMLSHPTLLAAVQLHPLPAVTWTVIVPPPDPIAADAESSEKVQGAASCATPTAMSLTLTAPLRVE